MQDIHYQFAYKHNGVIFLTYDGVCEALQTTENVHAKQHREDLLKLFGDIASAARDSVEVRRPVAAAGAASGAAVARATHGADACGGAVVASAAGTGVVVARGTRYITRADNLLLRENNALHAERISIMREENALDQELRDAEVRRKQEERDADARREQEAADKEAERQRQLIEVADKAKAAEFERKMQGFEAANRVKAADAKRKREDDDAAAAAAEARRIKEEQADARVSFANAPTWAAAMPFWSIVAQCKVTYDSYKTFKGAKRAAKTEWDNAHRQAMPAIVVAGPNVAAAAGGVAVIFDDVVDNYNYALGPADGSFPGGFIPDDIIAYYNGSAANTAARVAQHLAGDGSAVTKQNPHICKRLPLLSSYINAEGSRQIRENVEILHRMKKYGIAHCRGGKYADKSINSMEAFKDVCDLFELCKRCGKKGHFTQTCTGERFNRWNEPF